LPTYLDRAHQVGEREALANDEPLDLVELGEVRRVERLIR